MPTETQHLEQRVAALQSDLNARDQALDDAATENNERELSRRDWFDEARRLEKAAKPAPVERDERAMIKAFNDWAFYKKGEAIGRMDGQQAGLEGFIAGADWQARAALERKP